MYASGPSRVHVLAGQRSNVPLLLEAAELHGDTHDIGLKHSSGVDISSPLSTTNASELVQGGTGSATAAAIATASCTLQHTTGSKQTPRKGHGSASTNCCSALFASLRLRLRQHVPPASRGQLPVPVHCGKAVAAIISGTSTPMTQVLRTTWVGARVGPGQMALQQITPIDAFGAVKDTTVGLAGVLARLPGPPSETGQGGSASISRADAAAHLERALQRVVASYPLLAGRLMSLPAAEQLVGGGAPTCPAPAASALWQPAHALVYAIQGSRLKQPSAGSASSSHSSLPPSSFTPSTDVGCESGAASDADASSSSSRGDSGSAAHAHLGVPLVEVVLQGTSVEACLQMAHDRAGYSMASGSQASLPPFLQALNTGHGIWCGKSPLASVQLTWVAGDVGPDCKRAASGTGAMAGPCVLGITCSHVVADAFTTTHLFNQLLSAWGQELSCLAHSVSACECPSNQGSMFDRGLLQPYACGVPTASSFTRSASALCDAVSIAACASRLGEQGTHIAAADASLSRAAAAWAGAAAALRADARLLGTRAVLGGVTTLALHIPQCDLDSLRAASAAVVVQEGRYHGSPLRPRLSAHDVVCAWWWVLCCHLRGRPLPGQPIDAATGARAPYLQRRMMGITADMRHNCTVPQPASAAGSEGAVSQVHARALPASYLGNASCTLRISGSASSTTTTCAQTPELFPCAWAPGKAAALTRTWLESVAEEALGHQGRRGTHSSAIGGPSPLTQLLAHTAARVRGGVDAFRSIPSSAAPVLASFVQHTLAPAIAQASVVGRYISELDAFLTSWAAFPLAAALTGQEPPTLQPTSTPLLLGATAVIHPLAPWSAVALSGTCVHACAGSSSTDVGGAAEAHGGMAISTKYQHGHSVAGGGDGLLLYLSLPMSAVQRVKSCSLMHALTPGARWCA